MEVSGCTLTIDAMGCQKKIAGEIIEKQADYILAVKKNQLNRYAGIRETAVRCEPSDSYTSVETGHGRIEQRECSVYSDLPNMKTAGGWMGLKSVAVVKSTRTDKKTGKETAETRYYITSREPDAKRINEAIR